jgi:hypothetical protein
MAVAQYAQATAIPCRASQQLPDHLRVYRRVGRRSQQLMRHLLWQAAEGQLRQPRQHPGACLPVAHAEHHPGPVREPTSGPATGRHRPGTAPAGPPPRRSATSGPPARPGSVRRRPLHQSERRPQRPPLRSGQPVHPAQERRRKTMIAQLPPDTAAAPPGASGRRPEDRGRVRPAAGDVFTFGFDLRECGHIRGPPTD